MRFKIGNGYKSLPNSINTKANLGNIDSVFWYTELFEDYPIYRCDYDLNVDENKTDDVYLEIFNELKNSGDFYPLSFEYTHTTDVTDKDEADAFILIHKDEPIMVEYTYRTITISTHLGMDTIKSVIDTYLKKFNYIDNDVKCYIITNDGCLSLDSFKIKLKYKLDFDLYNEGFEDVHKSIVESINNDDNGLYILYGAPGTGKTTYIRNLIKECGSENRKFVYVPSNLFSDFTNPSIIPFLMDHKGCIFILEDCESLVTSSEFGVRSDNISNLLNMTDGLLNDALDVKIICTFNISDGKVDEALLRPGRCRCRYEFELLDKNRANKVAEKFGLKKTNEDISISKLFNNGKSFAEKKKKFGFE